MLIIVNVHTKFQVVAAENFEFCGLIDLNAAK